MLKKLWAKVKGKKVKREPLNSESIKLFRGIIWDAIEQLEVPYPQAIGTLRTMQIELEEDFRKLKQNGFE